MKRQKKNKTITLEMPPDSLHKQIKFACDADTQFLHIKLKSARTNTISLVFISFRVMLFYTQYTNQQGRI